ncbi:hypothetical protein LCGC14_1963610, partial [marine sediment metagenome]
MTTKPENIDICYHCDGEYDSDT